MAGKASEKRAHAVAKRCARLRAEGMSLSAIAALTEVPRDQVRARIVLGERLLSVQENNP